MAKIIIIDCSTGEQTIRDLTKKELAELTKATDVEASPE
jgi:hypothetical protein